MNRSVSEIFDLKRLREYLSDLYGSEIELKYFGELGKEKDTLTEPGIASAKEFGYGRPYLVEFEAKGKHVSLVLETMRSNIFGHEFAYDRAQSLLMAHSLFNRLPKHARSMDVGMFMKDASLKSAGNYDEFFILMEKVEGQEYYLDLERMGGEKRLTELDMERCQVLSDYLVSIHGAKKNSPELYRRRTRELLGHGECIMGLIDSYPPNLEFVSDNELESIEKKCIDWRWKLKNRATRLSQVHGDFHPWNILFKNGAELCVLDRSRGEWGEPADDLAAMTINYLFFSLQAYGSLEGPFKALYERFFDNYIKKTGDRQVLDVIQPYYVWRALVVASPIWYPNLSMKIRKKLFNLIYRLLDSDTLDPHRVNPLLE